MAEDIDWDEVRKEMENNDHFEEMMEHTEYLVQEYAGKIDARIFANLTYLDDNDRSPSREGYQNVLDQTYNVAMLEAVINDDLNYAMDLIFQGEEQSIEIFNSLDESLGSAFQSISSRSKPEEALTEVMDSITNYHNSSDSNFLNDAVARSMLDGVRPGEVERVVEVYKEFNNHKNRLRRADQAAEALAKDRNISYTRVDEERTKFDDKYSSMYDLARNSEQDF